MYIAKGKKQGGPFRKPSLEEVLPKKHHHDMLSFYQAFLFVFSAPSCLAFYGIDCIFFILPPTPTNLAFIGSTWTT